MPQRDLRKRPPSADWVSLDEVLYTHDKRFGAIGALLAFFGAFLPWATVPVSVFGFAVGSYGTVSPLAWLVAMAAIVSGIFLFKKASGSIVMVIGIVVGVWTLLSALTLLTGNATPSFGVLLTLVGAGLLAYSGHLTNQYEQ